MCYHFCCFCCHTIILFLTINIISKSRALPWALHAHPCVQIFFWGGGKLCKFFLMSICFTGHIMWGQIYWRCSFFFWHGDKTLFYDFVFWITWLKFTSEINDQHIVNWKSHWILMAVSRRISTRKNYNQQFSPLGQLASQTFKQRYPNITIFKSKKELLWLSKGMQFAIS